MTFVSAEHGWLVGTVRCGATSCTRVETTTDGGAHWSPLASVPPGDPVGIAFANASDGYAWASNPASVPLDVTRNGGVTWTPTPVHDDNGGVGATDVSISDGTVWILGEPTYPQVLRSVAGSTTFQAAGRAPNRTGILSASGQAVYVAGPQGAGPVPPAFEAITPTGTHPGTSPCQNGQQDIGAIAALPAPAQVVLACNSSASAGTATTTLYRSDNGGQHWARLTKPLDCNTESIGQTTTSVFVACLQGPVEQVSLSGGNSTVSLAGHGFQYVGFTNDQDGLAITNPGPTDGQPPGGTLYATRDGGARWVRAAT